MTPEQAKQSIDNDARALENSLKFLNEIGQLKAPGIQNKIMTDPALEGLPRSCSDTPAQSISSPQVSATPTSPPVVPPTHTLGRKIFFTGRLCAGKDHVAGQIKPAKILGFADPIYTLAEFLFNVKVTSTSGKDVPGMRKFLQTVGQWGRNEVNEKYPLTAERAMFCQMIRSYAQNKIIQLEGVDLENFGLNPDLWVDALVARAENIAERVIATNCRFPNEYHRLIQAGWQHWHIVCSPQTMVKRLATRGLGPNSPEVNDMSEQMALKLDKQLAEVLTRREGNKLQAIWSDEAAKPSDRLYSVEQFSKMPTLAWNKYE